MKVRWIRSYKEFIFGICQCGCNKPIIDLVFNGCLRKRISDHWYNKFKNKKGYIYTQRPEHPNSNKQGYIQEHRFIMSEYLGRPLTKYEDVHHINGIKDNNRLENLELLSKSEHSKIHYKPIPNNNPRKKGVCHCKRIH